MNNIHFENPDLLHLLWVLAIQALMLLFYWRWRTSTLQRLGTPQLEARLLVGFSTQRFWIKNAVFAVVVVLIALAIANPRRVERKTPPPKESADIIIALDVSRSMMAGDIAPNRLTKAKKFAGDLIKALSNDRVGLLVFAGDAFPQAPLTNDPAALLMFVDNASPNAVNDQGTDFSSALQLAQRMFPESEAGKALILITDGENHLPEAAVEAEKTHAEGITIYTAAVGTAGGATIPGPTGDLLRDYAGQVVRTRTDEPGLRELARAGGGISVNLNDDQALNTLLTEVQNLRKVTVESQAYTAYTSYFQWLILPALLLLLGEQLVRWRKGV